MSIDYNCFDVPNPCQRKKYTQMKLKTTMCFVCVLFLKQLCAKMMISLHLEPQFINENFKKCTMMYTRSMQNGIELFQQSNYSLLVAR